MSLTFGNFMNQIFEALGVENKGTIMKVLSSLDKESKDKIIQDVNLKKTMERLLEVDKNINNLNTSFLNGDTVKIFNSFKENLGFLQSLFIYKNIEVNTFIQNLLNLINLKIILMGSMNSKNNNKNVANKDNNLEVLELKNDELLALKDSETSEEENTPAPLLALEDSDDEDLAEKRKTAMADAIAAKKKKTAKMAMAKAAAEKEAQDKKAKAAKEIEREIMNERRERETTRLEKEYNEKQERERKARDKQAEKDRLANLELKKKRKEEERARKSKIEVEKKKVESNKIIQETKKPFVEYKFNIDANATRDDLIKMKNEQIEQMIRIVKARLDAENEETISKSNFRYEVHLNTISQLSELFEYLTAARDMDYDVSDDVIEAVLVDLKWFHLIRANNEENHLRIYRMHLNLKTISKRIAELDNKEETSKYNYYEKYLKYKTKYFKLKELL